MPVVASYCRPLLPALVPAGVVTVTSTGPTLVAPGAVAVMEVSLLTVNEDAAVEPKLTAVAPVNPLPVTATVAPPASGPLDGLILVTAGAARGWNSNA